MVIMLWRKQIYHKKKMYGGNGFRRGQQDEDSSCARRQRGYCTPCARYPKDSSPPVSKSPADARSCAFRLEDRLRSRFSRIAFPGHFRSIRDRSALPAAARHRGSFFGSFPEDPCRSRSSPRSAWSIAVQPIDPTPATISSTLRPSPRADKAAREPRTAPGRWPRPARR